MATHPGASDALSNPAELPPPPGPPAAAVTVTVKSPLEKPLGELTEEDIAQLTREDCRRFLKEKGMRRPSWNKSQAIQQVISLKALLETRPDDDGDDGPAPHAPPCLFVRRAPDPAAPPVIPPQFSLPSSLPPPPPPPLAPRCEAAAGDALGDPAPFRWRDPPILPFSASAPPSCLQFPPAGSNPFPLDNSGGFPRFTAADAPPVGQMTIFYGGKVNVYDGVPPRKARAIMQIAANPSWYDHPALPAPSHRPMQCRAPAQAPPISAGTGVRPSTASPSPPSPTVVYPPSTSQTGKFSQHLRENSEEWRISREVEPEGPTSRAVSLQRYLEKRKDRGRFKCRRNVGGSSSSSMDMYLSQKVRDQAPNGQLSRSDMSSPTQPPRPPQTPTRCSSIEYEAQNLHLSFDLNDEDIQEA